MILNKYQKVIAKIVKDDMNARFVKASFKAIRTEVRDFVKQMGFDFEHLVEHKNRSREENVIFAKFK
jgi:hypothetical protein